MQSTSNKAVRERKDAEVVCIASSRHGLGQTLGQYVVGKYGKEAIKHTEVLEVIDNLDRSWLRLQVHTLGEQDRKEMVD